MGGMNMLSDSMYSIRKCRQSQVLLYKRCCNELIGSLIKQKYFQYECAAVSAREELLRCHQEYTLHRLLLQCCSEV